MNRKVSIGAAAIAAALFFLYTIPAIAQPGVMRRMRQPKDLSPDLESSLEDQVGVDAGPYLDKENEKKAKGLPYSDLQQKFEYLSSPQPGGGLTCTVKLGGAEYNPKSKASTKG